MLSIQRPAGYARIDDPERGTVEMDTLQCVHCGFHWHVIPGSGRTRGFCMKCGGPHCGGPECWTCRPYQKLVDEGHW